MMEKTGFCETTISNGSHLHIHLDRNLKSHSGPCWTLWGLCL